MNDAPSAPHPTADISVPAAARWGTIGQIGGQLMRLVVLLVLARILDGDDFGLLEVALTVTGFFEIIKPFGTAEYVVQQARLERGLLSSLFVLNVVAGIGISGVLWVAAPFIAPWFSEHGSAAAPLIRWIGLSFFVLSFGHVQEALLRRQLRFRRLALVLFLGPAAYAAFAIPCAVAGWGPMSFAVGAIAEAIVMTTLLWMLTAWRPRRGGSWRSARQTFHFSSFLTFSEIVRWLTSTADRVVVGRMFGLDALGAYGLARRLLMQVIKPLTLVFHKAVFPVLARFESDDAAMMERWTRACAGVGLLAFPATAGLCVLAEPFIALIDAEKWQAAVPVLQIFAPVAAAQAVTATVGVLYLLRGRTDWLFGWSVFSGLSIVAGYLIGAQFGLVGVAWASLAVMAALVVPAFWLPLRLLRGDVRVPLRALLPGALLSLVMAAVVFAVDVGLAHLGAGPWLRLTLGVAVGSAAYLALLIRFQPPGFADLWAVLPRVGQFSPKK